MSYIIRGLPPGRRRRRDRGDGVRACAQHCEIYTAQGFGQFKKLQNPVSETYKRGARLRWRNAEFIGDVRRQVGPKRLRKGAGNQTTFMTYLSHTYAAWTGAVQTQQNQTHTNGAARALDIIQFKRRERASGISLTRFPYVCK